MRYIGTLDLHLDIGQPQTLPCFEAKGFINTAEGAGLYIRCRQQGTPEKYLASRDAYRRQHNLAPCPGAESAAKEKPTDAPTSKGPANTRA